MSRRRLGILLSVLVLSACGASATPAPSHAPTSPTGTIPATAQPSAQPVLPTGTGDQARFAAFQAHVSASTSVIAPLLTTLPFDVSTNNTSAVNEHATAIQTWAKAEADWLAANPYAQCYGGAFTNWDTVRDHAAKAAATALAGNYDQMEGSFAVSQYKKVAELMPQIHC